MASKTRCRREGAIGAKLTLPNSASQEIRPKQADNIYNIHEKQQNRSKQQKMGQKFEYELNKAPNLRLPFYNFLIQIERQIAEEDIEIEIADSKIENSAGQSSLLT